MTIEKFSDLPKTFVEQTNTDGILSSELNDKRVYYCERHNKELHIVCYDGSAIVIQADVNGDIHFRRKDVIVIPPSVEFSLKV